MMTVTSYAGPTQKKGKKREKKKEKEKEGRGEEEETAKLHRAGVNLTTYCLPPTAGAYRCLLPTTGATAAYCCLPLAPTTGAYCCLPLAPTRAAYYALRLRSSEACMTLTRAELSWSKRCCRLCVGPLERGWEENGLWRGGGRMRRSATLLLEASS